MIQVKLCSFRIQNYRSIIDSGWRSLAQDNITILIGQNESGKTTVLEALNSFYTAEIIDDIFRSDQSMPIVSCNFCIEGEASLLDFVNKYQLPPDLVPEVKSKKNFIIARKWNEDKSSSVYVTGDEIFEYYNKIELEQKKTEENILNQINSIIEKSNAVSMELERARSEKDEEQKLLSVKRKQLDIHQKVFNKAKTSDLKLAAEKDFNTSQKEYKDQEQSFSLKHNLYEKLTAKNNELAEHLVICKSCQQAIEKLEDIENRYASKQREVLDNRHLLEISTSSKDQKRNRLKLEEATTALRILVNELNIAGKEKHYQLTVANKVINNQLRIKSAEQEAKQEQEEKNKFHSIHSLAEVLMNRVPVFDFFEDFSGLLPNKIDLEDILNEHDYVEGYKAAKNFLSLAGLDSSFFREKNHRILKQRIEALNSDVTINFQDYWSQQVGKNSKIKLHFELEHYDYTVPEKSGKPYIEFWIKDKQERLYPKQRSRGVRWFLSFYLELKATAAENIGNRILLIDEPGLSLHARAQEDVLKVFEDLKETMQVIYSTHSPHLVKTDKLYRILAVQRAKEDDDNSESLIYEPSMLTQASADTLTPIYSLMGIRLEDQQFINKSKNIILPDTSTYYYIEWLSKLFPELSDINFIPSTDEKTLPLLINIMAGWQVNFAVVIFGSEQKNLLNTILQSTLLDDQYNTKGKVLHLSELELIEDVFSTLDFKKYILLKREGITQTNSEYIYTNDLSRKILATNFVNSVSKEKMNIDIFDQTSKSNIEGLFQKLLKLI
jgi:predicted ATP-dependent endonuclease of OLD family